MKTQEANNLRTDNVSLMQENERYRGLIETLLRHPAFTPFIDDISKNPAALGVPQQQPQMQMQPQQPQQPPMTSAQPTPQPQQLQPQREMKQPDYMNFDASQLQVPSQQPEQQQQQQVSLAMIPEENFSKLNIGSFQPAMNFNNYQNTVNAFPVTDVPRPDPVALLAATPLRLPATASSTAASDYYSMASTHDLDVLLAKLDGAAGRLASA